MVARRTHVDGLPAVYETMLRPDAIHTSYVVGVAWMDTKLLKATLYSGSQIPGGGPFTHSAPISPTDAGTLVAAFNAGFMMSDANGGYFTDNRTVLPLRAGAASFVVFKNGSSTVGQWGRDVTMGPNVVSVRQNLDLLVDNGQVVPAAYSPIRRSGAPPWAAAFTCGDQGSGRGERRLHLRGWTRARHLGPGEHPAAGRGCACHGTGHQHRLGQLQQLPALDPCGIGHSRQRH